MIKAITKMAVQANKTAEFEKLAAELVYHSIRVPVNEYYSCNKSENQPNTYCFIEFWRDMDAFQTSMDTEYFTRLFPQLVNLTEEEPVIELYTELAN